MLSGSKYPTRSRLPHSRFRQRFAATARILADAAVAVLLAPTCAACARCLDQPAAGPVCAECWHAIPLILPPLCDVCGDPLPSWRALAPGPGECGRCRRGRGHVRHARAIGAYEGSLRSIVHALKYDGRRSLAPGLAALLAVSGADVLEGADVVVPVPLHTARQRARGFNQAEDIARRLPIPMLRALKRRRRTPSQTDLPEAERYENVRGAFGLRRRVDVSGAVVIVVDDVSTTGATLDACACVLLDAGAREVRALTVARVVSKRP
jgi:ComF family protein